MSQSPWFRQNTRKVIIERAQPQTRLRFFFYYFISSQLPISIKSVPLANATVFNLKSKSVKRVVS